MKRRYFLAGAGTLTLSGFLSGCGRESGTALKVRLLKDSIPAQILDEFRNGLDRSARLDFVAEAQLLDLFTRLRSWQKKPTDNNWQERLLPFGNQKTTPSADLVTLGDYWLAPAIRQGLIQPLDPKQLKAWQQLPPEWREIVRRNDTGQVDPKGKVWGAPYRWGSTVIAYRRDKFESAGLKPPTDWSDLWREELRSRISLLNQPREVIGLTLKQLGLSYNTPNLDKVPQLKAALRTLDQQVKFYSSNAYQQPLILGDTWLAVGWSTDLLPLARRYRQIELVVPKSGTALWADLWVRPKNDKSQDTPPLVPQWIDFCWQPNVALQLSRFTQAVSPVLVSMKPGEIPDSLKNNRVILPPPEVILRSEFLRPLSPETAKQYQSLWAEKS
ncbi:MAG TPA: polyamine ABC transporter substrate-binding protein [Cyanobacteria bacterium UBA11369]|nr:polyamine ABC transporter substrate-binding protein [Cyanobacteria bacterium UBA11371]HBE32893.1 polyamine ABC transporter substrate-binding protein [Cyanobacteria bacterium UBA11368]HBE47635.1 polyamine ABC transporter substrate-binding protein [Cyanobacteria bacterium UBA11369]